MIYTSVNMASNLTENWALSKKGNYTLSEYYPASTPEADNPNDDKNLKLLEFYSPKGDLEYTVRFIYDADSDIIKEISE